MNSKWKPSATLGVLGLVSFISSHSIFGAGFILQEQSISGLGVGYSSGAAGLSDNSSMFFNPATLTLVPGQQVTAGVHLILPEAEFNKSTDPENLSMSTLAPTQGPNATSDKIAVVPNVYFSRPVSEDLVVGVAVTTPYGLSTSYEDGWVGRYLALETDLMTINTNFALGYKVSDQLSIGVGVSVMYGDAILSNAINFGLTYRKDINDPNGMIPKNPETLALAQDVAANLGTTKYDGHIELTGDDFGYGYNFGLLFTPSESTRIGLHYRSRVKLSLDGNADFTVGPLQQFFGDMFTDQAGRADLELPDTAQISIHHHMTPEWAIMADIFHTWWSKFDELNIQFSSGAPAIVVPEKWENVWRYSIGTTYQLNERVQLRGGLVIDESPVPGDAYRSPRIPDEDRLWVSLGMGYQMSDQFRLDLAYVHILVDDPVINNNTHTDGEHLVGSMDATVSLISFGGSYTF
ncbi:MAG: OmpP1/FadL family transporter [Opitutales bacterium]